MTRDRFTGVGLDRVIRLAWLERAASLALAGNDAKDSKVILLEDLKGSFRSERTDVRGSLDKTLTILSRVWLSPPSALKPLHLEGLELLRCLPQVDHLSVHWGMVTAVYPFWSNVAIQVGRLLRLQGFATAAHIQRRVRELYGERETASRRARYVLRSFIDWGVLNERGAHGIYAAGTTYNVDDYRLIAWMVEASLHSRANGSAPLKDLLDSPSLFPFRLKPMHAENLLAASANIDVLRHGLDDNLVMLRKPPTRGDVL